MSRFLAAAAAIAAAGILFMASAGDRPSAQTVALWRSAR